MGSAQLGWHGLGGTRGSFRVGAFAAQDRGWQLGDRHIWGVRGGVGHSGIDLLALAVSGGKSGYAWGLFVCLMWDICGIDWATKGMRGLDDSFGGMGGFDSGLKRQLDHIWLWYSCFCWCQRDIEYGMK